MGNFWEQSPLWQRREELYAEFEAAKEAREEAGESVLVLIGIDADAPRGKEWRTRRQAYRDAAEKCEAAFGAWCEADRIFKASPAGLAYARYFADPLTYRAPEAEETEAA